LQPLNERPSPAPLTAHRGGPLLGRARVPGDKSVSHRALILGALAVGSTRICGLLEGEDVLATARAMQALGVRVERVCGGNWRVDGVGVAGFAAPCAPLDFGNSGTGCRLVMGAVAGSPIAATFDGDASLRRRPMGRVLEPLTLMGAHVSGAAGGAALPVTLTGARDPAPILYRTPVPSAQVKSAILLAGLAAPGVTTVIEPVASRDHTERLLAHFGAEVRCGPQGGCGHHISLVGQPELEAQAVAVPADPSSAAFPMVAALVVAGSDIFLPDVMTNPLRTGLIATLREMGAAIVEEEPRQQGGEAMAGLRIRHGALRGVEVPPHRAPAMIDEYPVLAVAAAFAEGTTVMRGLHELRVKESDRLAATADMLRVNGVDVEISGDDLAVRGRGRVAGGGLVATRMDHRIAMSALVLGLGSDKPVRIDDAAFIATSFPGFAGLMRELGGDLQ
jgi:3-phosphoshikimate 1-carboxyvinyltransferase